MRVVGICHSDFDLLRDNYILPIEFPVIPGHEWTGEVAEVGSRVSGLVPGDRVEGNAPWPTMSISDLQSPEP